MLAENIAYAECNDFIFIIMLLFYMISMLSIMHIYTS